MHFHPSIFDIMVHLVVHLVREIKFYGLVYLRWMYPVEWYITIFKGYTKNHHRPIFFIIERYITQDAIEFCTKKLLEANSIGNYESRHDERYGGRCT